MSRDYELTKFNICLVNQMVHYTKCFGTFGLIFHFLLEI